MSTFHAQRRMAAFLLMLFAFLSVVSDTRAQVEVVKHTFGGQMSDGATPDSSLLLASSGIYYGTTQSGGTCNQGTVYSLSATGAENMLYSFGSQPSDGAAPVPGLVQGTDGNFYGETTFGGGPGGFDGMGPGTVFKITPGGVKTTLYTFGAQKTDGYSPFGALVLGADGDFYGAANLGGANGDGTIFKITPAGVETTLYTFGGVAGDGTNPNAALLLGPDGSFYGSAPTGGKYGGGAVFKVTPSGVETILYSFGAQTGDGKYCNGALVLGSDKNFYGTAEQGGAQGDGAVYKVTPAGVETVLYSFGAAANDGAAPLGALYLAADGSFYGVASQGGAYPGMSGKGNGVVFKVTPAGAESVLYSFGAQPGDGVYPDCSLVLGADGDLYGTAPTGGEGSGKGNGVVFKVAATGALTTVYKFAGQLNDGATPDSSLLLSPEGTFYGTTQNGGNYNQGTVYTVSATGVESPIYSFGSQPSDGAAPVPGLVQGTDGNFYGETTFGGGPGGFDGMGPGTVFKITPGGVKTTLYTFGAQKTDGYSPFGALVLGADGDFYGAANLGGANGDGTIFKITPAGVETTLYTFGGVAGDGTNPNAALLLGPDGSFYGSAPTGGKYGGGAVFKVTPSGVETILYSFGAQTGDGKYCNGALVLGSDKNFYGTAEQGGAQGDGVVYKVTPAGVETVLYSFGAAANDGAAPLGALYLAADGSFYGVASEGGAYPGMSGKGNGVVFKVTPAGAESVLYSFGAQVGDGVYPDCSLVLGSDGNLYGTTPSGGNSDRDGTLYALLLNAAPSAVTLSPSSVVGGTPSTGTVTLTNPSANATVVTLASSLASAALVPSTVTVPAGAVSATFPVATNPVTASLKVTISASEGGVTVMGSLQVLAPTVAGLTVSPASVVGGMPSTGTVTLTGPAPSGGVFVTLATSNAGAATVQARVTVPAAATNATFTIPTLATAATTAATITATVGAVSLSAVLGVNPPSLVSVTVAPASVIGGVTATGTVTLSNPAPTSGLSIPLASWNTSLATVPGAVTVAGGATSASFTVTTIAVPVAATVRIAAVWDGVADTASLSVVPPALVSLTLGASAVVGGTSVTGTVALSNPAPGGGLIVYLASWNTAVATVPGAILVPAGAVTAAFAVTTLPTASALSVHIAAAESGSSVAALLTVDPPALLSVAVPPGGVVGGVPCAGTITLTGPAPSGGQLVYLGSANASVATVSGSVTVPAGALSASFAVTPLPTAAIRSASILAVIAGGVTQSATLTVDPPAVAAIAVNPASVPGGLAVTGTVTLNGPAPPGGLLVYLASNTPSEASVPGTLTVPAGAVSASFGVTTQPTSTAQAVPLLAVAAGGIARSTTLSITPPALVAISVSPTVVLGGTPCTGTVTLSGPAPATGFLVYLAASNGIAMPPGTVTVAPGHATQSFPIVTGVSGQNSVTSVSILAAASGVTVQTNLGVTGIASGG